MKFVHEFCQYTILPPHYLLQPSPFTRVCLMCVACCTEIYNLFVVIIIHIYSVQGTKTQSSLYFYTDGLMALASNFISLTYKSYRYKQFTLVQGPPFHVSHFLCNIFHKQFLLSFPGSEENNVFHKLLLQYIKSIGTVQILVSFIFKKNRSAK